ncbi:helicase-related protein, partial [Aliarcobacter butzleri]
LPKNRQTMLFSATYEKNIETFASNILKNPIYKEISDEKEILINQKFYEVTPSEKTALIPALISHNQAKTTLIFCNMKITCEKLADDLYDLGLDILTLHSDLEQKQRDETMVLFSNKSYPILIATDVASRGLHIDDVDLVINYDLSLDEKIHTHRIGRTARAGKGGLAISLFTENEIDKFEIIKEKFNNIKIENPKDIKDDISFEINSNFRTVFINGGKKQKLRKGDILGALISEAGLKSDDIGKIDVMDFCSYVAVKSDKISNIFSTSKSMRIKGKYYIIIEK